jgi:hypothetical protein
VSIALESPTRPIVAKVDWVRLYMTGDPDLNIIATSAKGRRPAEERAGKHRYTLDRIRKKMISVVHLDQAIHELKKRLYPLPYEESRQE